MTELKGSTKIILNTYLIATTRSGINITEFKSESALTAECWSKV